jgi:two-component system NarL family response regulator
MAETRIRVFLADDHPLIRTGLSLAFENDHKVAIIGTADNGCDAVAKIEKLRPDIVLMDIDMPGISGISAIKALREKFPAMLFLILSTYNDRSYLEDSLDAGANGYLLKTIGIESLANLIVDISDNKEVSSPYLLYLNRDR